MKLTIPAAILVLVCAFTSFAQKANSAVEQELIRLDKAWTSAELKGDKKALAALVADDYMGTTQRGEVENKAQYLAQVAPNADMVRSDDYKVRIFGNIAIMTHRATVEGVRNIQFRSTHVWQKRKGKWQIIAHHGGQILPAEPDPEQDEPDPEK